MGFSNYQMSQVNDLGLLILRILFMFFFIHLVGVYEEYFTYTTVARTMEGENRLEP